MHIDPLNVLCAQLTRDLSAIAKFLLLTVKSLHKTYLLYVPKICDYVFDDRPKLN